MFPWFLLALRLEHGGICKKAALRKQEGNTGSSMPPGWKKYQELTTVQTSSLAFIQNGVKAELKLLFTLG